MENGDRLKTHERLACLETQVNQIMINHLPHLQASVLDLRTDMKEVKKEVRETSLATRTLLWKLFIGLFVAVCATLLTVLTMGGG